MRAAIRLGCCGGGWDEAVDVRLALDVERGAPPKPAGPSRGGEYFAPQREACCRCRRVVFAAVVQAATARPEWWVKTHPTKAARRAFELLLLLLLLVAVAVAVAFRRRRLLAVAFNWCACVLSTLPAGLTRFGITSLGLLTLRLLRVVLRCSLGLASWF